jgi:hypothetical protein
MSECPNQCQETFHETFVLLEQKLLCQFGERNEKDQFLEIQTQIACWVSPELKHQIKVSLVSSPEGPKISYFLDDEKLFCLM